MVTKILRQVAKEFYDNGYDMEAPGASKYYDPSWGYNTCIGWACENAMKAETALGLEPFVKVIPSNKEFINQVDKGNQQARNRVTAYEFGRPVHRPEKGAFLLQFGAFDFGIFFGNQAGR